MAAVLVRLAEVGATPPAGTKIQYLEVYKDATGLYSIRPCTVTVPPAR